jgi:hypothetical protein
MERIEAFGRIGFGIETIDQQDFAANKNGVYAIKTYFNGVQNFEIDFKRFSFSETKHLNRLIDYEHYKTEKKRVQKLFLEKNNPLSMYSNVIDNGFITISDETSSIYKIEVSDFKNNISFLDISIKGIDKAPEDSKDSQITPHYILAEQENLLTQDNISVNFPKSTFYEDFFIDFNTSNDTLTLHKPIIPVKKYFTISYDISQYNKEDRNQLYIAELVGWNNYPSYSTTKRKGTILSSRTKDLGTYVIAKDEDKPTIKPLNFKNGSWLSKYRFLKVKIGDKTSGISSYRATVNGKWILMEYDYKTKTVTHDFNDGIITDTKNNLKVIVIDNVGNSTTFETIFFRK